MAHNSNYHIMLFNNLHYVLFPMVSNISQSIQIPRIRILIFSCFFFLINVLRDIWLCFFVFVQNATEIFWFWLRHSIIRVIIRRHIYYIQRSLWHIIFLVFTYQIIYRFILYTINFLRFLSFFQKLLELKYNFLIL